MEKIKLTKAEARAMDSYRSNRYGYRTKEAEVRYYLDNSEDFFDEFKPLKDMGFDKFIQALYNGYEIEMTEEEKRHEELLKYYRSNIFADGHTHVLNVLNILGIKVKGIND